MIRFLFLFTAIFMFGGSSILAQHSHDDSEAWADKYCSTNEALEDLLRDHPEYAPFIEEAEEKLEGFTERFDPQDYARDGNLIIPVVFHIVHNYGEENISNEQIIDAVNVMTADFTMQNEDAGDVVDEFQSLVANVGVEFRLARLDPDGNCTNGIVRTVSSLTNQGGENLKSISSPWPRDSYLNIWVAGDLSSGAAGYTYNPASVDGIWGSEADGIVIKHTYVGSIGTGSPTRSRALTHEVGHWINLRHTWGGTNNPELDDNCSSDDNVSDTPNTKGWTSCFLNGSTCGSLDNVENYMEYSYCSKMFTHGQRTRMLASLNSNVAERNNLHSEDNLIATGILSPAELCNVEITSNVQVICAGDSVVYTDLSYHDVTSRNWTFEGGSPATASGNEVVVYYNSPGTFDVDLEVSNSSGTLNETFENQVKVWPFFGETLPYQEDFEGNSSFEDKWTLGESTGNFNWEFTDEVSGASGNNALMLRNRYLSDDDENEIISEPIDLSNTNEDVVISFKCAYARRSANNIEALKLWVSGDCGETWSLRGVWNYDFETVPFTNSNWFPSSPSHWQEFTVDNISASQLVSNFRFKFEFESDLGNNIFIDDINITGPVTTGIDDIDISSDVSVFPNPATSDLNIAITGERPYQFELQLVNTLGKVILSRGAMTFGGGQQQYTLNTSALSPGVYMLHLQTDAGKQAVKQVLIIR